MGGRRAGSRKQILDSTVVSPVSLPISRKSLSSLPIPLRPREKPVYLNLQAIFDEAYRKGRYDRLDYSKSPRPPLSAEDAEWANEILAAAGSRNRLLSLHFAFAGKRLWQTLERASGVTRRVLGSRQKRLGSGQICDDLEKGLGMRIGYRAFNQFWTAVRSLGHRRRRCAVSASAAHPVLETLEDRLVLSVIYDEAVSGDLSNNQSAPTALVLTLGTNSVKGSEGDVDIQDWVTVHIPSGMYLSNLVLASFVSVDEQGFLGVQRGTSFVGTPFDPHRISGILTSAQA